MGLRWIVEAGLDSDGILVLREAQGEFLSCLC